MEITGSMVGSVWYPDPVEGYEPKVIEKCDLASLPRDPDNPQPSLDQLPIEWGQWIVHDATKAESEHIFGFKNSDLRTLSLLSIADTWPAFFTDSSGLVHDFYSADELYYYVGLRAKQTAQAKLASDLEKLSERQSRANEAKLQKLQAKIEEKEERKRRKMQEKRGGGSSNPVRQCVCDTLRGAEEVIVR